MHVIKRLLLAIVAYFAAVLVALLTVVISYFVLSSVPGMPAYFSTMALSGIVMVAVPVVGVFVYGLAVFWTALPALVVALVSEMFALRQVWLLAPLAAAIAVGGFLAGSPTMIDGWDGIEGTDWADLAVMATGGLAGGVVYWLIAGRRAGLARPRPLETAV